MVTKEEAMNFLRDTATDKCFWVNNGLVLKNLEELANTLPMLSEESYRHHVNKEKNDFSAWIRDVIGDGKLATDLLSSKNKDSALKKIKDRVTSLRRKV